MESSAEDALDSIKSRTDNLEKSKRLGNLESVEEASDLKEIEESPLSSILEDGNKKENGETSVPEEKLLRLESTNEMQAPSMEVVVTAPTPTVQSPISDESEHCHENGSSNSHQETQNNAAQFNDKDKSDTVQQKPPSTGPQTADIRLEDLEEKLEMHQGDVKKEGDDSKDSIKSSENWFTAEEDTPAVVEEEKHSLNESNVSLDKRSSFTDSEADSEPLKAVGLTRQHKETRDSDSSIDYNERRLERKSSSDSSDFSLGPRAANPQEAKEIKAVVQKVEVIPPMSSQQNKDEIPEALRRQSTEPESDSAPKVDPVNEPPIDPHNAPSEARKREYLEKFQRQSTDMESEGLPSMPSEEKKEETSEEPFKRQSSKSSSSESESETSNKKIRRVSSSDDDSSSEVADTHEDVDDKDKSSSTDTDVPQPPEELELKQLKRLDTMKESPA